MFSERMGYRPARIDIQRDQVDETLRNKLWSAMHVIIFDQEDIELEHSGINVALLIGRLWINLFKKPIDTAPGRSIRQFAQAIRPWFFEADWFEVYDFIEAIVSETTGARKQQLVELVNHFLETEKSAYRVVGECVVEITTDVEIMAIEEALTSAGALIGVREHLRSALEKMSDRDSPDYRNSIKESISSIEALCRLLTGDNTATLGQAIKRLGDSGVAIHPCLEKAWLKLYGYTSDEGGIRHALTGESSSSYADAKYMLIGSCAFVSYLVETASILGLQLQTEG